MIERGSLIRLFGYMASSARGCIDEPKIYGPFRIVDSMSRIYYLLTDSGHIFDEEISQVMDKIAAHKCKCMTNEAEFVSMLDEIIDDLAQILLREESSDDV